MSYKIRNLRDLQDRKQFLEREIRDRKRFFRMGMSIVKIFQNMMGKERE